jgi:hypothetical protein
MAGTPRCGVRTAQRAAPTFKLIHYRWILCRQNGFQPSADVCCILLRTTLQMRGGEFFNALPNFILADIP